jgi:predicted nucleic acid-binding protein
MEVVLLDTNILIEILKGNQKTIEKVQSLDVKLCISSITVMELYYGAMNKAELTKLEKFASLFTIIELNESISKKATQLVKNYAKSHTLDIPDSLIASTSLHINSKLFTYNTKDFKYIEGIKLLA